MSDIIILLIIILLLGGIALPLFLLIIRNAARNIPQKIAKFIKSIFSK